MGIRTTASEWIKFIEEPLPGFESYPDQVSLIVQGVVMDDGAFDPSSFLSLSPDETVVVEGGVVFVDCKGMDLIEHFNKWRKENGIHTKTFVTFEIPDERLNDFMTLVRQHGFGEMVVDDLFSAPPDDNGFPAR